MRGARWALGMAAYCLVWLHDKLRPEADEVDTIIRVPRERWQRGAARKAQAEAGRVVRMERRS